LHTQIALDIASGMEYLHTAFERDGHDQPLIHRDLKSPNLLLATAPRALQPGEQLLVKVTDFGLAKDKSFDTHNQHTAKMTGCGSILWMAPEMLLGQTFNEMVDVYSFAM
jgi:serine/threonine protein kinase